MTVKKAKSQRSFYRSVKRGTHATGATYEVLCAMIDLAEFGENAVTATKAQICLEARRKWGTVLKAIAWLEAEGTIQKAHNKYGGRGNAVTWKFKARKDFPDLLHLIPEERQTEAVKALFDRRPAKPKTDPIKVILEHDATLTAWLNGVELVALSEGLLIVKTSNGFVADKLAQEHKGKVLEAAYGAGLAINDLQVIKAA